MELRIRNRYRLTVSAAILFFSPDTCAEYGRWGTRGWWNIPPGGEAHVLNTNNTWSYIYAEAADGTLWTDENGPRIYVRQEAFQSCLLIGDTQSRVVSTVKVRSGTVNLNPPTSAVTALPAAVSGQLEVSAPSPAGLTGRR
ncbi:DUF1036 domain-containing protein [Streptomyces sp. DSM 40750]|uniref:DUF1036 domain-containing protein n=1 Tax=Streptomyces sp. DSM 40750 TaxID=2801030 RepID=UPI00214B21E1|nr:DUF1036 domain-containing protein [Streptomyces sp. DSM 40750]UUU20189.1 DUF1036 domain-containing protein [Streptomyces sp. DSM 40750]